MFDVAVIGAGPAGAVAALTAARAGARVLLLDESSPRKINVGETLPPVATPVLQTLGLVTLFRLSRICGVHSVWHENTRIETDYLFNSRGAGWRMDRARFQDDMSRRLSGEGVFVCSETEFMDVCAAKGGWLLHARENSELREFQARGLVDATGRSSRVARRLGIKRLQRDRLVGALLEHPGANAHEDVLAVEAVSYGWWYTVRTDRDMRVFGLMTDTDVLRTLGARSLCNWWRLLSDTALVRRFANARPPPVRPAPMIVAAGGSRLQQLAGARWIAAGDAAIAFDPLSSQGVTTAMMTGYKAATSLLRELEGGTSGHADYVDFIMRISNDYSAAWTRHYQANTRFSSAPFWKRRHTVLRD